VAGVLSDPHAEAGVVYGSGSEPGRRRALPPSPSIAGVEVRAGGCGESAVPDESFDAVVNVEASSYYALPRFFIEVERVLRPGGFL
jgi:Methyltransferase domain